MVEDAAARERGELLDLTPLNGEDLVLKDLGGELLELFYEKSLEGLLAMGDFGGCIKVVELAAIGRFQKAAKEEPLNELPVFLRVVHPKLMAGLLSQLLI